MLRGGKATPFWWLDVLVDICIVSSTLTLSCACGKRWAVETDFHHFEEPCGKGGWGPCEPSSKRPVDEKRQFLLCKFPWELGRQVVG